MIEQARALLQRHLVVQILDARVDILPPVLIYIQLAVAVEILELQAFHLQNGRNALEVAQLGLRIRGGDDGNRLVYLIIAAEARRGRRFLRKRGQPDGAEKQHQGQKQG